MSQKNKEPESPAQTMDFRPRLYMAGDKEVRLLNYGSIRVDSCTMKNPITSLFFPNENNVRALTWWEWLRLKFVRGKKCGNFTAKQLGGKVYIFD